MEARRILEIEEENSTKTATTTRGMNRLMFLLDRLDRIRCASIPEQAEKAMTEFTFELLQLRILKETLQQRPEVIVFNKGDEAILMDLDTNGAITSILDAMNRFHGKSTPEFFNSACTALVHLAFQSKSRSKNMYKLGCFSAIVQMMQYYCYLDYIQIIGIAALMVVGKNIGLSLFDLEALTLKQIVLAMEWHQESSKVYVVACSALGTLFGPGSTVIVQGGEEENDLYHRALDAITYGLILHEDDQVALGVGNALLCNMVGPDVALEMIEQVETAHGGVYCAAAA